MDRKGSAPAGGRPFQDRRAGVQGAEGGHRQAGWLHQWSVLHPCLVSYQVLTRNIFHFSQIFY